MRHALPHANILIHHPWGGMQGQATDIQIHAREILRTRDLLNQILASHTGQPLQRISTDTERDYYMTSEQAKEYGLIDSVIEVSTAVHELKHEIEGASEDSDGKAANSKEK